MKTTIAIVLVLFATIAIAQDSDMERWRRDEQQRQYREQQERRIQDLERRQREIENERSQRQWLGPQFPAPGDPFRVNPQFKPYSR